MFFQNPPYRASRELLIPRIAAVGTSFSPLPCQAWHGYRVTSAHRVEVEVGADGPASAPLSGAAVAAPPAGAWEGLSGGLVLGLIMLVMLVCVRVMGVPVRLITMCTMSTCVPAQCERSAFAWGYIFL
jgi:hypothetical protein